MNIFKRVHYNAPVILTFGLICFAVLILDIATNGETNRLLFSVYRSPLADPLTYPRLFLHAIGHANWAHFLNNFMLLLLIGPMLEERYGAKLLIGMMVVTAFVTGVLHIIVFSNVAKLGASGIVFMFILLSSFTNIQRGRIPLTLVLVLILYIGSEVIAAMTLNNNIAYLTHIVGGLIGAVSGFVVNNNSEAIRK